MGISFRALFDGQKEFLSDCPKSLLAVSLKLSLEDWLDNSCFIAHPLLTEEDGFAPLPPGKTILPGESLPDGYGLSAWLTSNRAGAHHWLNILASIIDYYIAAVEPLLKHRIVAPTFPRDHLRYHARRKKQYRGKPAPLWKSIEECDMRYDEFAISLDELHREAIRRLGPGDEFRPKHDESEIQIDPSDVITFPNLMKHFEDQGWVRSSEWYERILGLANIHFLPGREGKGGGRRLPKTAAIAAISEAKRKEEVEKK